MAESSALCHGIEKVLVEEGHQVRLVESAGQALKVLTPDCSLVVLGRFADMTCEDAVVQSRRRAPSVPVIALISDPDRARLVALLSAGADGVLTAIPTPSELHDAILRVVKGERYVSPGLLAALFGDGADQVEEARPTSILTDRERYVLRLAAEGRSNREIAAELFISQATVKTHLQNVYAKLSVANRVQAVGRAIELRLLY